MRQPCYLHLSWYTVNIFVNIEKNGTRDSRFCFFVRSRKPPHLIFDDPLLRKHDCYVESAWRDFVMLKGHGYN